MQGFRVEGFRVWGSSPLVWNVLYRLGAFLDLRMSSLTCAWAMLIFPGSNVIGFPSFAELCTTRGCRVDLRLDVWALSMGP